jgi:hypothetical protein
MTSGSDEHERPPQNDDADPAEQLKEGLGLLFKAAKGIAHVASESVRTEVDKARAGAGGAAGTLIHALDDAGRELARAAGNVASKLSRIAEPDAAEPREPHEPPEGPREAAPAEPGPAEGSASPPEGGPGEGKAREPGFRIQVDPKVDPSADS